jgi:glycosyltransferase involved in cell wall biosynthesis
MNCPGPRLSVYVITFNQAEFVSKALDSVLMQRTTFDYEIIVGDDCSTDGTIEILKEYQTRFPGRIKPLFHEKNVGMMRNAMDTLQKCSGEYVACLEGDDYWTDPDKLQIQIEYLEQHPECALSHHKVEHIGWPAGAKLREFPPLRYRCARSDGRDLALFNHIQTCSVVFRRKWMPALDAQFQQLKLGDWPLFVLLSQRGWIGYLNRTMAHYRVHTSNSWNCRPAEYKIRAMENMAWYLLERVENNCKDIWRDTILALALKDLALAVKSFSLKKALEKLTYFVTQSCKLKRPFWIFNRLWPYYKANYLNE